MKNTQKQKSVESINDKEVTDEMSSADAVANHLEELSHHYEKQAQQLKQTQASHQVASQSSNLVFYDSQDLYERDLDGVGVVNTVRLEKLLKDTDDFLLQCGNLLDDF